MNYMQLKLSILVIKHIIRLTLLDCMLPHFVYDLQNIYIQSSIILLSALQEIFHTKIAKQLAMLPFVHFQ